MRSGAGVLIIAVAQLTIGLSLLGVFEGYKTHYFNNSTFGGGEEGMADAARKQLVAERAFMFRTPLDYLFWFSCVSSTCAIIGLAGICAMQPTLVTVFFAYNLIQAVLSFSLFVDVLADQKIRFVGEASAVTGYEKAAAGLLFLNFVLSLASGYFTIQAAAEIKQKQRETAYHEMAALGDNLQFEPDQP